MKVEVESKSVQYIAMVCNNLNQTYSHLKNEMRKLSEKDQLFLLSIFDATYAGEAIKGINKKQPKRKIPKDENTNVTNPDI